MKKHIARLIALAAFFLALPASAQIYFGGGLGRSHFNDVCTAQPCDSRDTAFNLFAGYQLVRFLGVEAAYDDFGHAEVGPANVKGNAWSGSGVFTVPFSRRFALFGKAGGYHGNLKSPDITTRKNGATFGGGVEYIFTPGSGFRLQWQRFRKMGGGDFNTTVDVDVLSLQVLGRF
jgi:hypothetical protein